MWKERGKGPSRQLVILSFVWAPEGVKHGGSKGRDAGFRGKLAELTMTDWIRDSLDTSGGDTSPRPYSNLAPSQIAAEIKFLMYRERHMISGALLVLLLVVAIAGDTPYNNHSPFHLPVPKVHTWLSMQCIF